jgi:hypothetical protein
MSKGGYFNQQARRSGGYRKSKILVGTALLEGKPIVCLPCFENRHKDCDGQITFTPDPCECTRHAIKPIV